MQKSLKNPFPPWQELNIKMKQLHIIMKMIFMTLVTTTLSQSIEGENFDPHCEGSLNIFDKSGKRHSFASTQDGLKKLVILNATVHGCGCFRMYKFSKGNGQSMFVSNGDLFMEEDLDFKYIRSIRKEKCSIPSPEPRAITKIDYAPLLVTFFMIVAGSSVLICIILLFICCKFYCCLRRSKKGEKQEELQRL